MRFPPINYLSVFLFFSLGLSSRSVAFPQLVRYGYISCTACHYSPNGGGLLKEFGRVSSRDLLSNASEEEEYRFLYGALPSRNELSFGGDIRAIQIHQETEQAIQGRLLLMQFDLESAVTWKDLTVVGTVGREESAQPAFFSRRHYLMLRPSEEPRLILRFGRFSPAFGIHIPDHAITTKRDLGWGQGKETYNLEGSWQGQRFDVFTTVNFGRFDQPSLGREYGFALRTRYYATTSSRVGLSLFHGISSAGTRQVFGPFASIGINERWFLMSEIDIQHNQQTWGAVGMARVGYEIFQGFNGIGTIEYAKLDFGSVLSKTGFWVGLQYFPRPHLEIVATWQKNKDLARGPNFEDLLWLMLHFYL